ncbi:response regulator [Candidatus Nomurabacteria bacterium]|nr:response regulator [Candidatus Nomurabacteria bacterium]MCB9820817.1 response regulator [Candidatus Nomurabacteria bacterium]
MEKKTIVIVDDDKFLLDMYSLKFHQRGYDVFAVMTPAEALTKLREGGMKPAIIIFDITMPVMDGITFLQTIKDENLAEESVLLALSNDSDENSIKKCKEIGVDEYIIKATLTPEELVEKVEKMIE